MAGPLQRVTAKDDRGEGLGQGQNWIWRRTSGVLTLRNAESGRVVDELFASPTSPASGTPRTRVSRIAPRPASDIIATYSDVVVTGESR